MASSSTLTNSKSFSAIIAKCGITNLQKTITCGNTTGGNNIVLSTGDAIVGQTNITLSSTGESSNIVLNPGASGEVIVNGKLNVTGLIDPTGLVLTEAPAPRKGQFLCRMEPAEVVIRTVYIIVLQIMAVYLLLLAAQVVVPLV
jgi:hypothetical protein